MKTYLEKTKELLANISPETDKAVWACANLFAKDFSHEELAKLAAKLFLSAIATDIFDDDGEEAVEVHELFS